MCGKRLFVSRFEGVKCVPDRQLLEILMVCHGARPKERFFADRGHPFGPAVPVTLGLRRKQALGSALLQWQQLKQAGGRRAGNGQLPGSGTYVEGVGLLDGRDAHAGVVERRR